MLFAIIIIVTITFVYLLKNKDTNKIFDIYSQPGRWYWVKYVLMLAVLQFQKLKTKKTPKNSELETLQQLSEHEKACDAVFFQAVNEEGFYLCAGAERRHLGVTNGLIYIVVPGKGILGNQQLPDTVLKTDPTTIGSQVYSAEGITFKLVKPMRHWKISYSGVMRLEDDINQKFRVKLEGDWNSKYPYFLFDADMSTRAVARAIAREKWTRKYFRTLKEAHQTHYEQMGELRATLWIDDEKHELNMKAFRDHSFAHKRDWSLMHRYAFHMLYLEDNTRAVIGVISQPCTTSHLEMGYLLHPDSKTIDTIDYCDLQLYQWGENGVPPKFLRFSFRAIDKTYQVEIDVEHEAEHFKGENRDARLVERFFRCRINKVRGRGIAEWHYNNSIRK